MIVIYKMSILGSSCQFVQSMGTDLDSYLISKKKKSSQDTCSQVWLLSVTWWQCLCKFIVQMSPGCRQSRHLQKRDMEPALLCGLEICGLVLWVGTEMAVRSNWSSLDLKRWEAGNTAHFPCLVKKHLQGKDLKCKGLCSTSICFDTLIRGW